MKIYLAISAMVLFPFWLSVGTLAQTPKIQTSVEHPTDQLWLINARNADTRTVSIDGGMLSDCVEVTNCDGSGFSHNIILKPGESAHVGDVTRAICTNPTDDDGNEIHQCEKRPPTTFKYQVFARYLPDAQQPKPRSSNSGAPQTFEAVSYIESAKQSQQSGSSSNTQAQVEAWITNQILMQNSSFIPINAMELDTSHENVTGYRQEAGGIRITDFLIKACTLRITVATTDRITNRDTVRGLPTSTFSKDLSDVETFSATMSDIQPSSITVHSTAWGYFSPPCSAPEPDCAVPGVLLLARSKSIEGTNNTRANPVMLDTLNIPLSTPTDASRFVKAFHDEVVSCGGTDVKTNLY